MMAGATAMASLGQALREMGDSIAISITDLSGSISDLSVSNQESARALIASVESLREERLAHDEKQLEKLDNIQRRKKF
ncbi:MAG: hypothetical protein HY884_02315 [Deltaproteobacteria bacterium]|nr:hypothetical protein [Deltaproteobacteria bacterium]